MVSSFWRRLFKRPKAGERPFGRKPSYHHRQIESAVDGILALKENLAAYVSRQAPVYRDMASILDNIVSRLNEADDYVRVEEALPHPILPAITANLERGSRLAWAFGILGIVTTSLSFPPINRFIFPDEQGQMALPWPSCPPVNLTSGGAESYSSVNELQGSVGLESEEGRLDSHSKLSKLKPHDSQQSVHTAEAREPVKNDAPMPDLAGPEGELLIEKGTHELLPGSGGVDAMDSKGRDVKSEQVVVETTLGAQPGDVVEDIARNRGRLKREPPEIIRSVRPSCPKGGILDSQRIVHLNVEIGPIGNILGVDQVGVGFEPFVDSAKRAVHRSRFAPGTVGGVAATMRLSMKFDFGHCQ
jgi:hypothetical protein